MPPLALYGISILFSFIAWGNVTGLYFWPMLRSMSCNRALRALLVLHTFRFVGLVFLVPGVVSLDLPLSFARPAAYGDFVAAILALLSIALLHNEIGIILVWIFNIWGATDLINAFYQGIVAKVEPGQLGCAYFIPTVLVPLLLITHGLVFRLLLMKSDHFDPRDQ